MHLVINGDGVAGIAPDSYVFDDEYKDVKKPWSPIKRVLAPGNLVGGNYLREKTYPVWKLSDLVKYQKLKKERAEADLEFRKVMLAFLEKLEKDVTKYNAKKTDR
jgi:hypothetical protein